MKRLGLAVLALTGLAFAGPYDTWNSRRDVTVNTTSGGANVALSVNNFPLLVRLTNASTATGSDVLSGSLSAGADVRFTDSTGQNALSFEVERWSASAADFWVKVPVVAGNASTKIRMYWGKAGQSAASSGSAVFDTANGFRAVWHMNGTTTESDATINGITMTPATAAPTTTVGAIGGARAFDSTAHQYFSAASTAANPAVNIAATSPYTLSAWVYAKGISSANAYGNSIVNKGDKQYCMQAYGATGAGAKRWETTTYTSSWREIIADKSFADTSGWVFVTGTWSGGASGTGTTGTGRMFVNGVKQRDSTTLAIGTPSQTQTFDVFIGANPNGSGSGSAAPNTPSNSIRAWHGYLDEISISGVVRDSDFVKLTYETQKPTASAITLGTSQAGSVAALITKLAYTDTLKAADTLVFSTGIAANISPITVGGPIDSFKVVGNTQTLPTGITLNKTTGALQGTATAVFTAGNRTIRAWGHFAAGDSISRTVRVSAILGPTAGFHYTQDTATYITTQAYSNAALYSGRAPTKFSVTPALPAGLTLDTLTGTIGGTPSAVTVATNYTVKGTNTTDTVNAVVRFTTVSAGTEDYTTWTGSKQVWLNTQSNGAAVGPNVVNFPVLVRMDSASGFSTMFSQALAGGADLRFTKGTGTTTRMPHQIERWDATAKIAEVWVLVDTVKAFAIQTFNVRWGKAGAVNLSYGPGVFDTANGFEAVWHMNGTTTELDATVNGFTAASGAQPTVAPASAVGPARLFNGTSQYLTVANSVTGRLNFGLDQKYTLSGWANPTAITTTTNLGHKIVEKGDNQYTLQTYGTTGSKYWEITTKLNNGAATWAQATSGSTGGTLLVPEIVADSGIGKWNHIVGTYNGVAVGGTMAESLYVNGVPVSYRNETVSDLATSRTTTVQVHIGVQSGASPSGTFTRYWNGALDEIRLESRARSASWIKLEYANQRPTGQNLVSFTAPTSIGSKGGNANIAGGLGMSVKPSSNGLMFSIQGAAAGDKAVLNLVDMWGRTVFTGSFENGGQLAWHGVANNGQSVSAGIYVARVTVIDAQSKTRKVLEHKVPFTR